MIFIFGIIATYLVPGFICAALLKRFFSVDRGRVSHSTIILAGFIIGPLLIPLLLALLFAIAPKYGNWLFAFSPLILFLFLAFLGRGYFGELLNDFKKLLKRQFIHNNLKRHLFNLLLLIFFLGVFKQGVCQEIVTRDGSIYAYLGRELYEQKTLEAYPGDDYLKHSFGTVRHPPGLALLYAWMYFVSGAEMGDELCRTVSFVYAFYLALLLSQIAWRRAGENAAIVTLILLFITPIFSFQSMGNTIDPVRLTLLIMTLFFLLVFLRSEKLRNLLLLTLISVLALFFHLGNALLLPLIVGLYVIFSKRLRKYRWFIVGAASISFFVFQFFIWNTPPEQRRWYQLLSLNPKVESTLMTKIRRENAFGELWAKQAVSPETSAWSIFWKERAQIISRPRFFGIIGVFGFMGAIFLALRRKRAFQDLALAMALAFITLIVIYKYHINYRYIATVVPLTAYFGGVFIASILLILKKHHAKLATLLVNLTLAIFCVFFTLLFALSFQKAPDDLKDNETGRIAKLTLDIKKFANWKQSSSPMAYATLTALKNHPSSSKILLTEEYPSPVQIYHAETVFLPMSSLLFKKLGKLSVTSDIMDFMKDNEVSAIIETSNVPNNLSETLSKLEEFEIIYDYRGIKVHKLK